MRKIIYGTILALFISFGAWAQTPASTPAPAPTSTTDYGFGAVVNWNNYVPGPKVTGTLGYYKLLAGNTYSITTVDLGDAKTHPFSLQANITTGIAQRLATLNKFQVFVSGTFGVGTTGTNTGGAYSGRILVVRRIKGDWGFLALLGVTGATVTAVQPVLGVGFGYQH